jgi:gamma-glutamyltranspeptidase/glutathione hydrolase
MSFSSRSPVLCRHGSVACSQPLAAEAGLSVLRRGGNAADAAVAVAAVMNVTQPCSTGIGGDCFCLFYDAASRSVRGLNGSGRAPQKLSLELLASQGYSAVDTPLPVKHAHTVTVPGAAAGWVDTVQSMGSGKLSLQEILEPAIGLAEEGYPVAPLTALLWESGSCDLQATPNTHGRDLLLGGRAPGAGEIMRMPHLATTFRALAQHGKPGFYSGRIGQAIVDCVQSHGGVMTLADLEAHTSSHDQPIKTCYRGIDIWEMPPNGQGITALLALNILEGFDIASMTHNSAEYLHTLIEALQLSFADSQWYCADPSHTTVPIQGLLSKSYAAQRRALMNPKSCLPVCERGQPSSYSDTVYFTVADSQGNACSFINSNYMGFGTGLVPEGCGFTLQNRGANFSLDPGHPNCLGPGKRPYHTIIPGLATHSASGELYASFGVMGGFMQPQGHVQVLLNTIDHGMDPQSALDAARFCIGAGTGIEEQVNLEEGIPEETVAGLRGLGHSVRAPVRGNDRDLFGRGQIICSRPVGEGRQRRNVWWAGSDNRADGLAVGF